MKKYLIFMVFILAMSELTFGAIRYVTPNGAGLKNGTSWKNAYDSTQLQTAINEPDIKGVYVAAGTYKPTTGTDRSISFNLKSGIEIYGGFNGTETSYTQRNWEKNITILSGDIGVPGDISDNSYHVVTSVSVTSQAILHGFTIQDGNANGISNNFYDGCGSGIFNSSSSPKIINCCLKNNTALYRGGGICNLNSSPYITNCTMTGNTAFSGGGIADENSSATLTNCLLTGNEASNGGGMFLEYKSGSVLNNCTISENIGGSGGGIFSSGSALKLTNCLIINNKASGYGGGLSASSSLTLINCTVAGNSGVYGGGIHNNCALMLSIKNSIIWNNKGTSGNQIYNNNDSHLTINYSCYPNGTNDVYNIGTFTPDANCININPQFINPASDFRIAGNSPCADAGNNTYNTKTTDIRGPGYGRKLLKTDSAVAGTIDMGAYEYNSGTDPIALPEPQLSRIFVKWDASGADNGSSWADAFTSLQSALSAATTNCEIWVAAGTYKPTTGTDRCISFNMKNGVAIYGGFAGTETSLNQRNWTSNVTILSGDLNGDDVVTGKGETLSITGNGDNSQHVVYNLSIDSTASLDGFTIEGGFADSGYITNGNGAGILNYSSSPVITNCIITENSSLLGTGGGLFICADSSPKLINCRISGNFATQGGGISMENLTSTKLINCLVLDNNALIKGGGIFLLGDACTPRLINCTLTGNHAMDGGGLNSFFSSPTIENSIIWGNTGDIKELSGFMGTLTVRYSCYANMNRDVVIDRGSFIPTNCISTYPKFVNYGSDFRIAANSPCADAGNNAFNTQLTDIRGLGYERKLLKTDSAIAGTIDMGAYEYNSGVDPALPLHSRIYVKWDAAGADNGNSWADAYRSLQSALGVAPLESEIWVATGTYKPTNVADRSISFNMKNGVAIYGGFAGTETSLNQRNWTTNVTILSGDLNGDDVVTGGGATLSFSGNTENTYHVIVYNHIDSTASIDGFTIRGGNANNVSDYDNLLGGGILLSGSACHISNCIITENSGNGIAIVNYSSPRIINCMISKNSVKYSGGGVFILQESSPTLINCLISNNNSQYGGGIYSFGPLPSLTNCLILNNNATEAGGGVYTDIYLLLTNCTIAGNTAALGGGAWCGNSSSNLVLRNSIIWGNNATVGGKQIYIAGGGSLTLGYSCYSNLESDVYSNGGIFSSDSHCTNANPEFVNPGSDFRIAVNSPCADAGNNAFNTQLTDIRGPGYGRKLLKTDSAVAGTIDMGAYEYNSGTDPMPEPQLSRIFVKWDASGSNNGSSWADAFTSLQSALSAATTNCEIWVAAGTYKPTISTDRTISFNMKNDVAIYGGFVGNETLLSQRDWNSNITILSGDLNGDDVVTGSGETLSISGNAENSQHVIYNLNVFHSATIDGFAIKGGNADSDDESEGSGGGIFNSMSDPIINNCIITGNSSSVNNGGGIFAYNMSLPTLINCRISENSAPKGGGLCLMQSTATLINCQILNNKSSSGGGIYSSWNHPDLTNCLIANNYAADEGGGVFAEEGFASYTNLTNCTVVGNSANSGGGILNRLAYINVRNSIIWDNNATTRGNQICMYGYHSNEMNLFNTCFSSGESDVYNYDGTFSPNIYCINEDPKFISPGSDFRITANSPCADAGNNDYNSQLTDMRGSGYGRKLLKTDSATAGIIDMGAYEYNTGFDPGEPPLPTLSRIYVKWDATGAGDGSSWTDAYTSLRGALRIATAGNEIWVAAGTYKPGFLSFNLKNGVALFGGFAGNESLLSERKRDADITMLLGETYQDVIYNSNIDSTASIDGFIIKHGQVELDDIFNYGGIGIHNSFSSPTITNCVITGNYTIGLKGAGITNDDYSSPKLVNCRISDNTGGGIANSNNSAPTLYNCIISKNYSTRYGSGLGIRNSHFSSPKFINCTVSAHTSQYGGGLGNDQSSSLSFKNSIIWNNGRNAIYNHGTILLEYSCYANGIDDVISGEGTFTATNCITTDPEFLNSASDFRISGNSPCVDAGYNNYNSEPFDIRGQARIQNSIIDMGAYEWSNAIDPLRPLSLTSMPDESASGFLVLAEDNVISVIADPSITGKARIADMAGRTLSMENLNGSVLRFNLNLLPGIYVVSILTKTQTYSKKVVIR